MNLNSFGLLEVIIFVLLLAGCDSSMNLYPNPDMKIDNQQEWQKKLYFERITEFKKDPIGENKLSVEEQTMVIIDGINKEHVGRQAAKIRSLRKPNPFTGKGIKYTDEEIRRKSGKSAVGAGGAE